jgi:hypothetical protein
MRAVRKRAYAYLLGRNEYTLKRRAICKGVITDIHDSIRGKIRRTELRDRDSQ